MFVHQKQIHLQHIDKPNPQCYQSTTKQFQNNTMVNDGKWWEQKKRENQIKAEVNNKEETKEENKEVRWKSHKAAPNTPSVTNVTLAFNPPGTSR